MVVTYYHITSLGNLNRGVITDSTAQRDAIDVPVMRISNFEMKVPAGFTLTWDGESSESTVAGDAVVYPGVTPNLGDVFIYGLTSGQIGVFRVISVEPLSYHSSRLHRVSFQMRSVLDATMQATLDDRVVKSVVFDKAMFFDGNKTLLTEDSYAVNKTMIQMRAIMLNDYYREFFADDIGSLRRPDGIYDPYVVAFINQIVSFTETNRRPGQLLPEYEETYRHSVWHRLNNRLSLSTANLCYLVESSVRGHVFHDLSVNGLVNRPFIYLRPDLDPAVPADWPTDVEAGYVLSEAFYTGNVPGMNAFDTLIYEAITTRKISDVTAFIATYVDAYESWTPEERFYRIPAVIKLMALVRSNLAPSIR